MNLKKLSLGLSKTEECKIVGTSKTSYRESSALKDLQDLAQFPQVSMRAVSNQEGRCDKMNG